MKYVRERPHGAAAAGKWHRLARFNELKSPVTRCGITYDNYESSERRGGRAGDEQHCQKCEAIA